MYLLSDFVHGEDLGELALKVVIECDYEFCYRCDDHDREIENDIDQHYRIGFELNNRDEKIAIVVIENDR